MALSRINALDMMNVLTRVSRTAVSLEMQRATSAEIHREQQQQCVNKLHMTSMRRYAEPPQLDLPTNMRDICANETGRFTPERSRDIALYSEDGGLSITVNRTGFPRIIDKGHVDSYDCFGAVSLHGTMQTNVPIPFCTQGSHEWVQRSMHLNMPGGQNNRYNKYIAEDMQRSHYRNLRLESCKGDLRTYPRGSATNTFITNALLQTTHRMVQNIIRTDYSTDASRAPKDGVKGQSTTLTSKVAMSKKEKFRLMLRDYGSTMLVFHITLSLISLGACYMVVVSGVDVTPFVKKISQNHDELSNVIKTSTDFVIAYTLHKLFAPVRISVTLGVTPPLVRRLRRMGVLKMPKVKPSSPS